MKKTFLFLIGIYTVLGLSAQLVSEYDINDFTTADHFGQVDWTIILNTTDPVDLSAGSVAFQNIKAQNSDIIKPKFETHLNEPVEILKLGKGHYLFDFGLAYFGTLSLKSNVPQKDTLVIHLAEELSQAYVINRNPKGTIRYQRTVLPNLPGGVRTDIILSPDKRNSNPPAILLPDSIGVVMPFRYCEIENLKIPIDELSVNQKAVHYVFNDSASMFTSSDTILNQIWDLCKHTIKATSFTGYYVDGDRERIPYEADAYINQLSHYAVDSEYSLARRTNEYFISHPTWPTEWILHTAKMFYYDYLYTGDKEPLYKYYESLKDKALIELAREDGLISTESENLNKELMTQLGFKSRQKIKDIVDWPKSERDGYEMTAINTVVNSFYYENLQMMALIAGAIGNKKDSAFYAEEAIRLKNVINDKLFDKSLGIYIDGEGSSHSSLHANMFPLAFGLVPEENLSTVVNFIKTKGMACSVYGAQYLLEGLYKVNESEYALQLITDTTHNRTWWNMIEVGSTITLEAWDNEYKPNLDWNHAWGAAPANIITRNLWGIRPKSPGFNEVEISPQLEGLNFSEITVPTINGQIHAKFKNLNETDQVFEIQLPETVNGQFKILNEKYKKIVLNGKVIKHTNNLKLKNGYNFIEISL